MAKNRIKLPANITLQSRCNLRTRSNLWQYLIGLLNKVSAKFWIMKQLIIDVPYRLAINRKIWNSAFPHFDDHIGELFEQCILFNTLFLRWARRLTVCVDFITGSTENNFFIDRLRFRVMPRHILNPK